MIATKGKVVKLFEANSEVYSDRLPIEGRWLYDLIYIKHSNCYLMLHNKRIYRKEIDDTPFTPVMKFAPRSRVGGCFEYSTMHQRPILTTTCRNISAINVETKKVEIKAESSLGTVIQDFKLFGRNQDRVAATTEDGYVLAFKLNFQRRRG